MTEQAKAARAAYIREYQAKNKEKIAESRHKYYEAHKEQIKANSRRYYEAHKEEIKARTAVYWDKKAAQLMETPEGRQDMQSDDLRAPAYESPEKPERVVRELLNQAKENDKQ